MTLEKSGIGLAVNLVLFSSDSGSGSFSLRSRYRCLVASSGVAGGIRDRWGILGGTPSSPPCSNTAGLTGLALNLCLHREGDHAQNKLRSKVDFLNKEHRL